MGDRMTKHTNDQPDDLIILRGVPVRVLSNDLAEIPHTDRKKPNLRFMVLIVEAIR